MLPAAKASSPSGRRSSASCSGRSEYSIIELAAVALGDDAHLLARIALAHDLRRDVGARRPVGADEPGSPIAISGLSTWR